jgi:hypothetical protein
MKCTKILWKNDVNFTLNSVNLNQEKNKLMVYIKNKNRKGYGARLGPPKSENKEKNLGGRPKKWDGVSADELAESLDNWIAEAIANKNQFWWWDWCFDVGLSQGKVAAIAKYHERFRVSYEKAKEWQESVVARFALTKKFSEGFSKFMLVNHYKDSWKEKAKEDSHVYSRDELTQQEAENMVLKSQIRALQEQIDNITKAR